MTTVDQQPGQGWQLEGSSPEAYERFLVPALFEQAALDLVERAAPEPGERVLDVACGTGIVARAVVPMVGPSGTIVGLDVNPAMLAVAREASSPLRPPVEWRQGNALSLPFPDANFDVVLCQQGLQFFSDRGRALEEMHRVCAPRGRLALSVWRRIEHSVGYAVLSKALERHCGPDTGAMMRSPFVLGDLEKLRVLVIGAGFREVHIRLTVATVRYPSIEQLLWREAASSPLAGPLGHLSDDARDELIAEVAGALRSHLDDDGIAFPIEAHVVVAFA